MAIEPDVFFAIDRKRKWSVRRADRADIGQAGLIEERRAEEDKWTFIEECKNPKAVTIFIRGGSQRVVDEAERSMHDAVMVVKDVLENPGNVAGGGAVLLPSLLR